MTRKTLWKRIGILAGVCFVVFMVGGIILAGKDVPPMPSAQTPIFLQGGHIINHHIRTKAWSLDFDSAQMTPDQSSGTIDGVHDGVIFRKGKPYLKISAQNVSVNTGTLDFTATGLVHVVSLTSKQPQSFDTDLIVWSNATHHLTLDHPSYFHTGSQTLKVQHVVVDLNTKDSTIKIGQIDGTLDPSH